MPTARDASNFCARYSVVGMIFMVMVSLMLTYQPFYIGGIEDIEQATKNAYGGAGSFLFCFLLSVVYLVIDALSSNGADNVYSNTSRHSNGVEYESVPTSGIGGPDLMLETMDFQPGVGKSQFT